PTHIPGKGSSCLPFPLSRLVFPSGIYIFIWLDPSLNLCSNVTFSVRSLLTTQERNVLFLFSS
uniref:Uncharacterized protein n=1 Tax=Rhinolophus ferrumequinum TaxID=59479 RepID=A0A671DXD6_RHIFE